MAGIKDYSPIPASNTALFPEGMAPSAVNDGMRQVQADLREWYNDAQWAVYGDGDAAFAVSYVSPTSFAIVGADVAAAYHPGRRVKASGALTGTIYGSITASTFATNTTVTVLWDGGAALQNEALTISLGIVSAVNSALPVAATATPGSVRLATATETGEGVLADKAVTPAGLAPAQMIWTAGHTFRSSDDTAAEAVAIDLDRASPSPAANDLLMALRWRMRDSGGGTDTAAKILARLLDPTAGNEDAELQLATLVAGTLAARLILGQGAYTPNAPGGDKGPDSINALELYARGNPVGYQAINVQTGAAYALVQNDLNAVVKLTAAAGCTVTLPSIAAVGPGWRVRLLNASTGGGDVTVQRSGTDPIDGGGTSVKLQSAPGRNVLDWWTDGAGWFSSERRFRSTAQTISSGAIAAVSHGLGATPRDVRLRLKCLTAQAAFEVGDEIHYNYSVSDVAGAQRGVSILADPTNVEVSTTSNANVFALISEGGGVAVALTNTNWEYYVEAEY